MIKYDKEKQPIETIHMTFLHRRTLKIEKINIKKKLQTSRSAAYRFSVTQASFFLFHKNHRSGTLSFFSSGNQNEQCNNL